MTKKPSARNHRANATRSSFRSIKVQEGKLIRHLRSRRILWLHGWAMGLLTLGAMWLITTVLLHGGVESMAVRYAVALGAGYLVYLLLLRLWAGMLVREEEQSADIDIHIDLSWPGGGDTGDACRSGNGGDCGSGGADVGCEPPTDALAEGVSDAASSALGDIASGALEAAGAADEAAIVVIPVLAVFAAVAVALFGAGWLLLAYFGTEALLATAVELAFAYTAARTVVRVEREGWLLAAVRLTYKPLLGALVSAVLLGALIDHFIPQANSLPEAVRLWRAR